MRKSLWIMVVVMVVAVSAPNAHADSFSVSFTNLLGGPTPTASDVTFPSPTLDIMWQGIAFALTLPSSSLPTDTYTWDSSLGCADTVCNADIGVIDVTSGGSAVSNAPMVPATFGLGDGSLTFTPVAAPEPSSVALMLLGVGLVFVLRKRNSRGHQLAA